MNKYRFNKDRFADELGTWVLVLAMLAICIAGFFELYEIYTSTFAALTGT